MILVANKCDGSIDDFTETARRVQQRVLELLHVWHGERGLRGRSKGRVTDLTLLAGMSRVSCDDKGSAEASGLPALIGLISRQTSTSIRVPPAWDLALEVIGALRASRDPIAAARETLGLSNTLPAGGVRDLHAFAFISKDELFRIWTSAVENVRGHVQEATISNWESALEGALWIRYVFRRLVVAASGILCSCMLPDWNHLPHLRSDYGIFFLQHNLNDTGELNMNHMRTRLSSFVSSDFAGHTLRIDGGDGIFLDVLWLSRCLSPILSHKLGDERFEQCWLSKRDDLTNDGILRCQFAVHLWSTSIGRVVLESEQVAGALFGVLVKLGVALPLGHTLPWALADRVTPLAHRDGSASQDMLVIMRLSETCNRHQQQLFRGLAPQTLRDREVTLKWEFDKAGPPYGLVERLIVSCHVLGEVEMRSCWRYGAVVKSRFTRSLAEVNVRLYTVALSMTSYTDSERVLTAKVFGPLDDKRVWLAIRYVASAMVNLSKEWPGVLWDGWLDCEKHPSQHLYLASSAEVRACNLATSLCVLLLSCKCRLLVPWS